MDIRIDVKRPNDDDVYPMSEDIRLIVDFPTGRGIAEQNKGLKQHFDASEIRIPLGL
jgi:hypothetical protein